MEPKETFSKFRTENTLSLGKDLGTTTSLERAADVLVREDIAKAALARSNSAEQWQRMSREFDEDSPQRAVIDRSIDEAMLISAAARQVVGEVDNSDEIGRLEEKLFDYYSPNLFFAAAKQKIEIIEAFSLPADLEPARAILLDKLDVYASRSNGAGLEKPTDTTLEQVGNWLSSQFGDLLEDLDSDGVDDYTAPQMVSFFQAGINSTPSLRNQGWRAEEIARKKSAVSTYSSQHKVVVPTHRTATKEKLKGLLVHEIFGHALRSAIAEENEIPVGNQGTATYARFEESFLIALEQGLAGKYNPDRGLDHYLAVGLSVTGKESKDETANIFESLEMLAGAEKGISGELRDEAKKTATTQIGRTFVGMTDVDDGVAHRKDIDYLHGLDDSWRLLNYAVANDALDETMHWLLSAKFNPFTAQDRGLISSYVSMPLVLQKFFTAA